MALLGGTLWDTAPAAAKARGHGRHDPPIRNLVLCGEDLSLTGDALLALWEEGIGDDDTLPRAGGKLYPEMDRKAVDLIRQYVKLWDWRGKSPEEIGRSIGEIPSLSQEMEPLSFAPVDQITPT